MSTAFSAILRQARIQSGVLELSVPDDWLQGRSLFGGLQAALALLAMRSLVPIQPLRSLQTNFIAPLAGTVRAQATILRAGKNTTQLEAKLCGDGGLAMQCLGIFGERLTSAVRVELPAAQAVSGTPFEFPFLPGVTPNFTQHFAMRLLRGHMPFAGVETLDTVYQIDLRDEGAAGESQLIAIADVVPPLALSFVTAPTFGSTLSWFLEILHEPAEDAPLAGWRLDSTLLAARDGYTEQSTTVYAPGGQAMALSRQCMLVFG